MNKIKSLILGLFLYFRVVKSAVLSIYAGDVTPVGRLYITKISADGTRTPYGLVSTKVVTTAFVNYLVTCLNSAAASNLFRHHATGTGTTAEAIGQTTLVTEVATRTSGTQTVGASNNIYRTVGLITYAGAFAITEHGIFSAASAGVMADRSVFAAINVIATDSIEFTYELTLPAGS